MYSLASLVLTTTTPTFRSRGRCQNQNCLKRAEALETDPKILATWNADVWKRDFAKRLCVRWKWSCGGGGWSGGWQVPNHSRNEIIQAERERERDTSCQYLNWNLLFSRLLSFTQGRCSPFSIILISEFSNFSWYSPKFIWKSWNYFFF